jgi:queuine tRNA-ribosyltransferase
MPVGTAGTVKGITPAQVEATGARIVLSNTYHLHLQPGEQTVARLGGLHGFTGWQGPILTDSGGYQVFSLPNREIDDYGVTFRPPGHDGPLTFTAERAIEIQHTLGTDIMMAFDECSPFPCSRADAKQAVDRTVAWADRCIATHKELCSRMVGEAPPALFGIVQGSTFQDLRRDCLSEIIDRPFDGIAIGGVSVGEGQEVMLQVLDFVAPALDPSRARYLMGVGYPLDILEAIDRGFDMFDCVVPTRYGRSGSVFTNTGRMRINEKKYAKDRYPIDTSCTCATCKQFSRGYLNHLFSANETLGGTLCSIHNLHFYAQLMSEARMAIMEDRFRGYLRDRREQWARAEQSAGDKKRIAKERAVRREKREKQRDDSHRGEG